MLQKFSRIKFSVAIDRYAAGIDELAYARFLGRLKHVCGPYDIDCSTKWGVCLTKRNLKGAEMDDMSCARFCYRSFNGIGISDIPCSESNISLFVLVMTRLGRC